LIPVLLFSLTIHEYSHGKVAYILGDDTAKRLGRLSLNPLRHIDPIGVLFFIFVHIGWSKPVPVDWRNFQNPRKDMMYVSLAGPLANIILAALCSFFVRIVSPQEFPVLFLWLCLGIFVNVALAVFNMLPIFPLDGASVLKGLVSQPLAEKLSRCDRYGFFLLIGILLLDNLAHTGILNYILYPVWIVIELMTQEVFPTLYNVVVMTFVGIYS